MPDALTIWCNAKFPDATMDRLRSKLGRHKLLLAGASSAVNLDAGKPDPLLEQSQIAFGQPDPDQVTRLKTLRWVQLTSAGYTRYDTPAFRAAVQSNHTLVCNASSVYSEPCAQHTLAMILALARRIPQSRDNQRESHAWPYLPLRAESVLLNGQTILLVGYGAIARRLAELLAPLRMNVIGFRRQPTGDEGAVKMAKITELDDWLPQADHIVNILPASPETDGFFSAERFAKLKPSAIYYNIGRGTTNDEAALRNALTTRKLAAAYLDAFATEPLPANDPLWTTPNCLITPHTAGGHATEFERHVDLFLENLRRLEHDEALIDRVM